MNSDILNVDNHVLVDNAIVDCQIFDHPPYANTTYNNSDEIRIPLQTKDIYTLPSKSYLYIEGRLTDSEGKESATLNFVNNGLAHLFDEIRFEIGGCVIDRVRNPGITSTLKGYISFTESESNRLNASGWNPTLTPQIVDSQGYFNVCIPLRMLLGFFEDYKKIIINIRQELVLIRSSTDLNAIISTKANEKPKIELTKMFWKLHHVQVSDIEKLRLINHMDAGKKLELDFRSWELHEYPLLQQSTRHTWNIKTTNSVEKPRYVIVGFQTNKKNDASKNMSRFDHCNLTNMKLYLNSQMYPYTNLNLNFEKNIYAILYEMYANFQENYYYKDIGEPCLSNLKFRDLATITVIDCSNQNDSLKSGSVDIRLEFETSKNISANTTAFCLIIHDKSIKYNPLTNVVSNF
ncbi:unnamed protein product [Psylliodes chrysocephalus]|uniref:Double jelly roll-like domain-containing protein n=1 Tax=Psylliodes chrysocephalus TaxID=3402493 RepID=A0A9P0GEP8_9CUCU|nr:unnamed protein product [Psylliodes chrysocephala]